MLFNSFDFAIFLPIVFIIYWCLPHKYRWILLLISSYYFYMSWNAVYVVLIASTTVISFLASLIIERDISSKSKKAVLIISSVITLGILFFFKYFNFLSESFCNLCKAVAIPLDPLILKITLPVGISFYTFQTLSYVIDVYRGKIRAEHHLGYYATFVSFFPQLVAGPIERTENLLPQIKGEHHFDYEKATYGLKLMVWGFIKKIIIADRLAVFTGKVFESITDYTGFSLLLSIFFFTFQIYCDFSGYSDIAIGTSKLLDIDLMTNFKSPYMAQSVTELWNRWHISLSSWFKDYVYIPLGGNRVKPLRHKLNLIITFLASGLWHGANWTYVLWGGVNGVAIALENILSYGKRTRSKGFIGIIRVIGAFSFFMLAFVVFVSPSMKEAVFFYSHLFTGIKEPLLYLKRGYIDLGLDTTNSALFLTFIPLLGLYDYFSLKKDVIKELCSRKLIIRWAIYLVSILALIFFSKKGVPTDFVYFQF